MKRIIKLFLTIIVAFTINQSLVVAGPLNTAKPEVTSSSKPLNKFAITNGLEYKTEYTFDEKRTITGIADKDSIITISILEKIDSKKTESDEFLTLETYDNIVVGKSEIFSEDITLKLGESIIKIEAIKGNSQSQVIFYINRLDTKVKSQLENIVLPNQKFNYKEYVD